jgi:hypothetical protein
LYHHPGHLQFPELDFNWNFTPPRFGVKGNKYITGFKVDYSMSMLKWPSVEHIFQPNDI